MVLLLNCPIPNKHVLRKHFVRWAIYILSLSFSDLGFLVAYNRVIFIDNVF